MDCAEVSDFILENYPISQTWEPDSLNNWISWANVLGFLTAVYDYAGGKRKLVGIAIARPMAQVDRYIKTGIEHDHAGSIIWVDLLIAPTKRIYQAAAFGMLALMGGDKKSVAYLRRGRLKVHDLDLARKALLRK